MKKHLIWLLLFLSSLSYGQTLTAVTATITDPSGQAFANGTVTAQYIQPSSSPGTPMSAGVAIATTGSASLNGSGVFTINLADLATVSPSGGAWQFTICPQATSGCQQINSKLVTGTTVNLSASLSAQITTIVVGPNVTLTKAYKDAEVPVAPGILWLDAATNKVKYIGATNTVQTLSTGSGTPGGSTLQFQFNNAGAFAGAAGLTYDTTLLMPLMQVFQMSESTATSTPASGSHWVYVDATSKALTCLNSNSTSCLPSGVAIQTNTTPNTSQTTLDFTTSTANSVGLTITPSNPSGGVQKFEITGGAYTGTASNVSGTPTLPSGTILLAPPNTQTASYVLAATDCGSIVRMNITSSANTVTVQPNGTVPIAIGCASTVRQVGTGVTTIVPGAGVTITTPSSLILRTRYSSVQLIKVATDSWDLLGDTQ